MQIYHCDICGKNIQRIHKHWKAFHSIEFKDFNDYVAHLRDEERGICEYCSSKLEWIEYRWACPNPEHRKLHRLETLKKNNLAKYGVKNVFQLDSVKEKIKETSRVRYGYENPSSSEFVRSKVRKTCIERYGGGGPTSSAEVRAKVKDTLLFRYGVDNPRKIESSKTKARSTCLKKYGVTHPSKLNSIKERKLRTRRKNHPFPSYPKINFRPVRYSRLYIGVLSSGGSNYVKIGIGNPWRRWKSIEVLTGYTVESLFETDIIPNPRKLESYLHKKFKYKSVDFPIKVSSKWMIEGDPVKGYRFPSGTGWTEWFDHSILDEAIEEVKALGFKLEDSLEGYKVDRVNNPVYLLEE